MAKFKEGIRIGGRDQGVDSARTKHSLGAGHRPDENAP